MSSICDAVNSMNRTSNAINNMFAASNAYDRMCSSWNKLDTAWSRLTPNTTVGSCVPNCSAITMPTADNAIASYNASMAVITNATAFAGRSILNDVTRTTASLCTVVPCNSANNILRWDEIEPLELSDALDEQDVAIDEKAGENDRPAAILGSVVEKMVKPLMVTIATIFLKDIISRLVDLIFETPLLGNLMNAINSIKK